MDVDKEILVWRHKYVREYYSSGWCDGIVSYCKYCGTKLIESNQSGDNHGTQFARAGHFLRGCKFCGWGVSFEFIWDDNEFYTAQNWEFMLKEINDINSEELYNDELGLLLSTNYKQINLLSPRKFEVLIAEVFKNHGYHVTLTKQTRDHGIDMILLESNDKQIIVEAKRYRNKVGVGIVRQLAGVQLIKNAKTAKLITSGYYTKVARDAAKQVNIQMNGFSIDLLDATDVLKLLQVYNSNKTLVDIMKIKSKYK